MVLILSRCLGAELLKDNMKPHQYVAQWNTDDPGRKMERKIKDFLEAGVDEGLFIWAFTGVCSVCLKE